MIQKTSGLILHTTKYSENSLIVKAYTRNFGLQSYIVSSGKNKKSKNKALFQPLALVEIEATGNAKGGLSRITEINLLAPYSEIPYNIVKTSVAMFLNEMLYRSIKEEHTDEDLFDFLKTALQILDLHSETPPAFHIYFLIQLSKYLGFYPQGNWSNDSAYFNLKEGCFSGQIPSHNLYLTSETSKTLGLLIYATFENLSELSILKVERKQLLDSLVTYYKLHIPSFGEIKSQAVLEEVIG